MQQKPIGVFDSGIGGLTVLKEIFREIPGESTIYLGDTARVPYGIRSAETVRTYCFENTGFLTKKGIKLLVIACNTASAVSLQAIKERLTIPVIGVIEPGAKAAVGATRNRRIGVIGTEATVQSGAYTKIITELQSDVTVFSLPCPLFVPLAEEGFTDNDIALMVAERYLLPVKEKGIDTLVLGCTHYPLLKNVIAKVMGNGITLIDSAIETAREIREIIRREDLRNTVSGRPEHLYYVTDAPERFRTLGERFLEQKIEHIEKIHIGGL